MPCWRILCTHALRQWPAEDSADLPERDSPSSCRWTPVEVQVAIHPGQHRKQQQGWSVLSIRTRRLWLPSQTDGTGRQEQDFFWLCLGEAALHWRMAIHLQFLAHHFFPSCFIFPLSPHLSTPQPRKQPDHHSSKSLLLARFQFTCS